MSNDVLTQDGSQTASFMPAMETVGVDSRFSWTLPLPNPTRARRSLRSVWYIALPITSAHRGGHSGGGALVPGVAGQDRYSNEGTVYPHASLVEMLTYQNLCFPEISWRYVDLSHESWPKLQDEIRTLPPDVVAFSVYSATAIWAYIVAATVRAANPQAVIVFGNDHASTLREEILQGHIGRRLVDFVGLGNNGPFTMMGLLYHLRGQMDLAAVPSVAYRLAKRIVAHEAPTYPLAMRVLPDYRLIREYLETHYDGAFAHWYAKHYVLKRMVTLPIDGGCNWGRIPGRRCKHCSIVGLTPKVAAIHRIVPALENLVGEQGANVYCAGDSTLGFSKSQWGGGISLLDELAEACASSSVLERQRFMLCYGLPAEFLAAAELCKGFVRTWNVGIEAFDPHLLRADSKGVNRGKDTILEALDLARRLDYRLYVSGILGLPGTTLEQLRAEVSCWLELAEEFQDILTTISVAAPAILPGSRMYWDCYNSFPAFRPWHGELLPSRGMSAFFVEHFTDVTMADVEAAVRDVGRGVISVGNNGGNPVKFGGYMLGGSDSEEEAERRVLHELL